MERPLVIPLRASTPATGLRLEESPRWGGHGDGLGRLRGTITHRAIELTYTLNREVDLRALAHAEGGGLLAEETLETLVAEVDEMVTRFRTSVIGQAIASPEAQAKFEAPFAWDWRGVPVHGTVDLLYRDADGWRVVDFKTDRVAPGRTSETAAPYLVQLGVYAGALEAATGGRPRAGILFLRTGEWYEPSSDAIDGALAEARRRIDDGTIYDAGHETTVVVED